MERQASNEWGVNALNPETHVCFLYETEDQLRAGLTSFIREGVEKNEKVVCIADPTSLETPLEAICSESPNMRAGLETGQVTLLKADETYFRSGVFDPDEMIALLKGYTEETLLQGYAGLRVTGQMTWALTDLPGADRLLEYEARINDFFHGARCLALCQYPVTRFPAPLLLDVLRTHPQVLIGAEVYDNPHYVPPSILLGTDRSALDLRRWIADIVQRKAGDAALRASEAFFREITENASDMVLIVNREGILTYVSPSIERFMGYRPEELIGRPAFDLIHPSDRQRAMIDFAAALHAKETAIPNSFRVLHKDGSERVLEGLGKNLLTHPAIAGFIMNVQDVTAGVAVEKALRESEERFRDLYDEAPVGYFEYDLEGNITRVNRTELNMLGYTAEEMIGQPCWKFIVDDEARDQILAKLNGVRPPAHGLERTYRRKDGTTFPVLFEDRLLMDVDGRIKGIRTTIQDITERKRAEKEREKLIQELQKALSEVRKLSGMLPICASCKKIRDDQGYWNQVEAYLTSHSDVQFSHSICPECARKLYPEYYDVMFPGGGENESSEK